MSIRQGNKIIAGNVDNADYTTLLNKPQINSIELNGNKTLEELGIQASGDYATTSELELKADKADTLAGYGITDGLNTSQITNCITKIPQDIKLEINDGALTIKAGSKVYIPNGIGIFDEYIFSSDLIRTKDSSLYDIPVVILLYRQDINFIDFFPTSRVYSGNTAPDTSMYDIWFDTLNNKIKTNLDTVWTETNTSLPFAIGTVSSSSGFTTINQVFNGFGYIGSTVFVLPGVEGLAPNGRNDDGSLNNIKFMTTSVLTQTVPAAWGNPSYFAVDNYGFSVYAQYSEDGFVNGFGNQMWYDSRENLLKATGDNLVHIDIFKKVYFLRINHESGRITSFSPKTTFQAIDRNDTEWASIAGKPSYRYIDLTLQANGTTYTAPANGWIQLIKTPTGANQYLVANSLDIPNTGVDTNNIAFKWSNVNGHNDGIFFPVRKGQQFTIGYTFGGATISFKFIYDEGAK